ncbi:glycoside hydrolase family 53 protein [Macrolepiota fuliginosa MF-IS2]|uniref:Arabinogalactan endo-beta-1,4-galactanase n=1 Tax=Macrolepiota fuliginosa MF-IS2 TaxID=1400762 RepID=A0A9P6C1J5_9AGAR|nr:glycoside hydrolase family 53 protein [Macrolepiota fuliginosa MF-IS2]
MLRFLHFLLLLPALFLQVQAITWRGADFSSLANLESSGRTYRDTSGGAVTPFEKILHNHGANLARIRIWTSTSSSQYSLNYGLALAKRAAAAGMSLLVDLHYSDTWADPGHQSIPSAWPTDLSGLNTEIWTYTRDVVNAFASQGTPIQFIQIGNEINDGLLWPTGRISTQGFSPASQLLHSAATGVRAATGGSSVKIMVHIANGWDSSGVNFFYNGIFLAGQFATSDFDLFGFSFYPFYNSAAKYSALQSTLTGIANKFNKDIMVVETDWPATGSCSGVTLSETSVPISVAGQTTWFNGIKNVLSAVPNGHGIGVVYWEPGWIGNAGLGSSCSDNLLVDGSGVSRSSMSMFSS